MKLIIVLLLVLVMVAVYLGLSKLNSLDINRAKCQGVYNPVSNNCIKRTRGEE